MPLKHLTRMSETGRTSGPLPKPKPWALANPRSGTWHSRRRWREVPFAGNEGLPRDIPRRCDLRGFSLMTSPAAEAPMLSDALGWSIPFLKML